MIFFNIIARWSRSKTRRRSKKRIYRVFRLKVVSWRWLGVLYFAGGDICCLDSINARNTKEMMNTITMSMWELKGEGKGDGRNMPWLSDGFLWFIITISNSYYVAIKILGNELTSIPVMLFDFIILYLIYRLDSMGRKTIPIPLIIFVIVYS